MNIGPTILRKKIEDVREVGVDSVPKSHHAIGRLFPLNLLSEARPSTSVLLGDSAMGK
jgi:hypothetical protein